MCTLGLAFKLHRNYPVVLAANRDEMLDRPSSGPMLWPGGFVAPRDERAGGTWLGLTKSGLVVGVTSRFPAVRDPERMSRGELVVSALSAPSAGELHKALRGVDRRRYNAFHLLYADRVHAFVTWCDGEVVHHQELAPGLHVLTERSFSPDENARAATLRRLWPSDANVGALQAALRETGPTSREATYVHAPEANYGTRSSVVLLLASELAASKLFSAEGQPPDAPAFVERHELLLGLSGQ